VFSYKLNPGIKKSAWHTPSYRLCCPLQFSPSLSLVKPGVGHLDRWVSSAPVLRDFCLLLQETVALKN
jgi:hypothetical protein